jgi:hypothetical protein
VNAFGFTDTRQEQDPGAWLGEIGQLERWRAAMPGSPLPDVVLAETFVNLGWKSRGGGYAFTVRDTGWAGFNVALVHARELLDSAATKRPITIEWYLVRARMALGLGWTSEESEKLFQGAIACDSTCDYAYWQRADYLLPRWYGEPGEWEAWLENAVAPLPPDDADRVYAAVCTQLEYFHQNFYTETHASWPRVRRGLALDLERHPQSQLLAQEFAFNAAIAGDVHVAHLLLARTGPRFDPKVWRSRKTFTGVYLWVQARDAKVRTASAH